MSYTINNLANGKWIEIEKPSSEDIDFLRREFPTFKLTNLEDSQERVQRAKLDLFEDHMFMSVTVPINYIQGKRLSALEFSFFLTKDAIVTITQEKTDLFKEEKQEGDHVANIRLEDTPSLLAYRFLEKLYDTSSKTVDTLGRAINEIDANILDVRSSSIIRNISIVQRNLI